ncbi:hypothetical protein ACFQI3_16845 [Hansschlegelia quercus]|nr:hypothetical protein [Hansschlegelia quercus]
MTEQPEAQTPEIDPKTPAETGQPDTANPQPDEAPEEENSPT